MSLTFLSSIVIIMTIEEEDMTYRTHQTNKKNGVTYVLRCGIRYGTRNSGRRATSRYASANLTDNRQVRSIQTPWSAAEAVRDPAVTASAQIVGPSVVLDSFSKRTGLEKILKSCFPDTHRQISAMANYLAIEGGALSHCESWAKSHEPALSASLTSSG